MPGELVDGFFDAQIVGESAPEFAVYHVFNKTVSVDPGMGFRGANENALVGNRKEIERIISRSGP